MCRVDKSSWQVRHTNETILPPFTVCEEEYDPDLLEDDDVEDETSTAEHSTYATFSRVCNSWDTVVVPFSDNTFYATDEQTVT